MQIQCLAKHGDVEGVRARLCRGVAVDLLEPNQKRTPLHYACASTEAKVDMVELLLDAGANIDAVEQCDSTPLRLAAASCSTAKVNLLISRGCSLRPTTLGYTPLIDAISHGASVDLIGILLSAGVEPNTVSLYGESALLNASHQARFDVVRFLLEQGASSAGLEWDQLHHAIALGAPEDTLQAIRNHKGLFDSRDRGGRTPMLVAFDRGDLSIIDAISVRGVDVRRERSRCGRTALMHAVVGDRIEVLNWCLEHGEDVNATNDFQTTPLIEASKPWVHQVRTGLA